MANHTVLISSDGLGAGDEKLGRILLEAFLRLLLDKNDLPKVIILWNAAVKAATRGAETVDHLKKLEERGVDIISCRTCVDYFGLEDDIAAGRIDGMVRIQEILLNSEVVTI